MNNQPTIRPELFEKFVTADKFIRSNHFTAIPFNDVIQGSQFIYPVLSGIRVYFVKCIKDQKPGEMFTACKIIETSQEGKAFIQEHNVMIPNTCDVLIANSNLLSDVKKVS